MNYLLVLILALAAGARAGSAFGRAVECHFDKSYFLIAATEMRAFLELRSYEHDRIVDSVVLGSRYMPPDFEIRDVVAGDGPEFIVRTRGGGTGFAETHFAVYGIVGQRIRRFGDFVVDRQADWSPDVPDSPNRETLSGKVSFPKKNELRYRYTQVRTQNGKAVTNSVTQLFSLCKRNRTLTTDGPDGHGFSLFRSSFAGWQPAIQQVWQSALRRRAGPWDISWLTSYRIAIRSLGR